jgi:hypothetical protein
MGVGRLKRHISARLAVEHKHEKGQGRLAIGRIDEVIYVRRRLVMSLATAKLRGPTFGLPK